MSKVAAGQSMKQMFSNKDWWKGMFSNIVSTMIGIILTIGIASLAEYHNDKKLAREMMFNVIKTDSDNIQSVKEMDSIYTDQIEAIYTLLGYYTYDGEKFGNLPKDSLERLFHRAIKCSYITYTRSKTEAYFYSAQMMHQFNNPEVYAHFSLFVEYDANTDALIASINKQAKEVRQNYMAKRVCDNKTTQEALGEIIRDHSLYNYLSTLRPLKMEIKSYRKYYKSMLQKMNATQEEFDEYVRRTSTDSTQIAN